MTPPKPVKQTRPRLIDIAERAGLSVTAVSLALGDHPRISLKTKRQVWKIAEELGYRPTPGSVLRVMQRTSSSLRRIGLLATVERHDDPFHNALVMRLTAAASRLKMNVEIACLTYPDPRSEILSQAAEFAAGKEGLIVTGCVDAPLVGALEGMDVPFVILGAPIGRIEADCVTYDGEDAGRLSTAAFLRQGHKRIAFICEPMLPGAAVYRFHQGYMLALLDAGLAPDPSLMVFLHPHRDPIVDSVSALLKGPGAPTALVVPNPFLAQTVLGWLTETGKRIPIHTLEVKEMLLPAIQGLPAVLISVERLAEFALRRLQDLCVRHADVPLLTHVPFELRGF